MCITKEKKNWTNIFAVCYEHLFLAFHYDLVYINFFRSKFKVINMNRMSYSIMTIHTTYT